MNDDTCFLITILYGQELLRCALKIKRDIIGDDCAEYPMEPENREKLYMLLPEHVKSIGPIVSVEEIFEIHYG